MTLIRLRLGALMALCALLVSPAWAEEDNKTGAKVWTIPDIGALPDNARGQLVRRGSDLITATYA